MPCPAYLEVEGARLKIFSSSSVENAAIGISSLTDVEPDIPDSGFLVRNDK